MTAAIVSALAEQMRGAGISDKPAEFDSSIHSWRCEYPDIYGACDCFGELVRDLATLIAAERADAAAVALASICAAIAESQDLTDYESAHAVRIAKATTYRKEAP